MLTTAGVCLPNCSGAAFVAQALGIVGAVLIIFSRIRRLTIAQFVSDRIWTAFGDDPGVMAGRFGVTFPYVYSSIAALALVGIGWTHPSFTTFVLFVWGTVRVVKDGLTMRREADAGTAAVVAEKAAVEVKVEQAKVEAKKAEADREHNYKVLVGIGAGVMAKRGHAAGIAFDRYVYLSTRDLAEHVMIMGRSGGGKTLGAVLPIASQLLETTAAGMFAISAKRNFTRQIAALASAHEVAIIGPEDLSYNIGRGVKPAAWGNIVEQAFALAGGKGDAFFSANSVLRVRHAAGVLCGLSGDTTPREIRDYIFSPLAEREAVQARAETLAFTLASSGDRAERERADWIADALDFERGAWAQIETAEKTRAGILAQCNTVFDSLATRALDRAFGRVEDGAELSDLLTGKVIILDIDRDTHGRLASSIVALCMFEQFSRFMAQRLAFPASDPRRRIPVSFLVDEYADCISPQHVEFFRKARESMVCGVVALQGDDVMLQALRGDRATMGALLSLFSQKITLPVLDTLTVERISKWVSKSEQIKHSSSFVEGSSTSSGNSNNFSHGKVGGGGGGTSQGSSASKSFTESISVSNEDVFTSQQFAELQRKSRDDGHGGQRPEWFQAVYTGFQSGVRLDDVVWLHVSEKIFQVSQM